MTFNSETQDKEELSLIAPSMYSKKMPSALRHRTLRAYATWIAIAILLVLATTTRRVSQTVGSFQSSSQDSMNRTLGFETIIALNMPERSDKRDILSLAASLTNVHIEYMDGVDGDTIVDKARPPILDKELTKSNKTLGCWRAHMNAWQRYRVSVDRSNVIKADPTAVRMVKENIQTALILEDDVDWDVNIKQIMLQLAHGSKYIEGSANKATTSPYGGNWDMLWLGHCGLEKKPEVLGRYYITENDPTVIAAEQSPYSRRPPLDHPALRAPYARMFYKADIGICAYAYALSQEGARKLLYEQTIPGIKASAADLAIRRLCQSNPNWGGYGNCIGVWPSMFTTFWPAGPTERESDRTTYNSEKWRKVGYSRHTVFSTRLNFESLLKPRGAEQRIFRSQYPNETILSEYSGELRLPEGRGIELEGEGPS